MTHLNNHESEKGGSVGRVAIHTATQTCRLCWQELGPLDSRPKLGLPTLMALIMLVQAQRSAL